MVEPESGEVFKDMKIRQGTGEIIVTEIELCKLGKAPKAGRDGARVVVIIQTNSFDVYRKGIAREDTTVVIIPKNNPS